MPINKLVRRQAEAKRVKRRIADLGLPTKTEPSPELVKIVKAGGYRIPLHSDRKRFGKSTGKRHYGHFNGRCASYLEPREARERAARRDET